MECPYCKVEITYNAEICPLCHMPVSGGPTASPSAYPKKNKPKKLFTASFEKLYVFCSLHVFALSVLLNLRFFTKFPWSAIVLVLIVAGFLIMKAVFNSKSKLHMKKGTVKPSFGEYLKRFFHF